MTTICYCLHSEDQHEITTGACKVCECSMFDADTTLCQKHGLAFEMSEYGVKYGGCPDCEASDAQREAATDAHYDRMAETSR